MVGACGTYKGEEKCSVLFCKPEVNNSLQGRGTIILKWGLKNGWAWNGFVWLMTEQNGGEGDGEVVRTITNLKAA